MTKNIDNIKKFISADEFKDLSEVSLTVDSYILENNNSCYKKAFEELTVHYNTSSESVFKEKTGIKRNAFLKLKNKIEGYNDLMLEIESVFPTDKENLTLSNANLELYKAVLIFKNTIYNLLIVYYSVQNNDDDDDDYQFDDQSWIGEIRKKIIANDAFKLIDRFSIKLRNSNDLKQKVEEYKAEIDSGIKAFTNFLKNNNGAFINDHKDCPVSILFDEKKEVKVDGNTPNWLASVRGHKTHTAATNTYYSKRHPVIIIKTINNTTILGGENPKDGIEDRHLYHIPYFKYKAEYEQVLAEANKEKIPIIDYFYKHDKFQSIHHNLLSDGEKAPVPAIEQIYDKLSEVFGGTNPQQVFSMLMPGSSLNIDDFRYNTNEIKPTAVKEAESRLANQMFDIAKVLAGSNGQKVSAQYMQALSVLVPVFSPLLPQVKSILREYINRPAPEATVDGQPFKGTLQDYYFIMYDKWLEEKAKWQSDCDRMKHEFFRQDASTAKENYLDWFETNGEIRMAKINALFGKILSVYSPSDMDAILGALTSGPGGEIEEALNLVNNVRLMSASGNYVYPVDFSPSNWSQYLQSDINPVNLLKDPEYILQSLNAKKQALKSCLAQLVNLAGKASSSESVTSARKEFLEQNADYEKAFTALQNQYTDNTLLAVQMYLEKRKLKSTPAREATDSDLAELNEEAQKASTVKREGNAKDTASVKAQKKESGNWTDITIADIAKIGNALKDINEKQNALTAIGRKVADSARSITALEASLNADISFFQARLESLAEDVSKEEQNFLISLSTTKEQIILNTDANAAPVAKSEPNPDKADPFMTFQFSFVKSQIATKSDTSSSASDSKMNVNFFFGGYSNTSSASSATVKNDSLEDHTEIRIGFKAAKVDINREWLNPGIFKATDIMSRMTKQQISKGAMAFAADNKPDWSKAGDINSCLFPAFPTAFIVAKDVVIEFSVSQSMTKAVHEITDQKSSGGGGFFCFSAAKSTSNRSDVSSMNTESQGTNFRISIPSPQILAWYQQLVPEDKSKIMDIKAPHNSGIDQDLNIVQFVKAMRDYKKESNEIIVNTKFRSL